MAISGRKDIMVLQQVRFYFAFGARILVAELIKLFAAGAV
jgi:hypothetical protein